MQTLSIKIDGISRETVCDILDRFSNLTYKYIRNDHYPVSVSIDRDIEEKYKVTVSVEKHPVEIHTVAKIKDVSEAIDIFFDKIKNNPSI